MYSRPYRDRRSSARHRDSGTHTDAAAETCIARRSVRLNVVAVNPVWIRAVSWPSFCAPNPTYCSEIVRPPTMRNVSSRVSASFTGRLTTFEAATHSGVLLQPIFAAETTGQRNWRDHADVFRLEGRIHTLACAPLG